MKEQQWRRPSSWNHCFQITEAITVTGGSRGRQTAEHVQRAVRNKGHRGQRARLIRLASEYGLFFTHSTENSANKPERKVLTHCIPPSTTWHAHNPWFSLWSIKSMRCLLLNSTRRGHQFQGCIYLAHSSFTIYCSFSIYMKFCLEPGN